LPVKIANKPDGKEKKEDYEENNDQSAKDMKNDIKDKKENKS
jgi:hypothetical protein